MRFRISLRELSAAAVSCVTCVEASFSCCASFCESPLAASSSVISRSMASSSACFAESLSGSCSTDSRMWLRLVMYVSYSDSPLETCSLNAVNWLAAVSEPLPIASNALFTLAATWSNAPDTWSSAVFTEEVTFAPAEVSDVAPDLPCSNAFWACLPALVAEASSLPVESTMSFAEPSSCEYDVTCCDAPLSVSAMVVRLPLRLRMYSAICGLCE